MERYIPQKRIYPLLALVSTICIFFCGLVFVRSAVVVPYIILIAVTYVAFGLGKNLGVMAMMFIPLALVSTLLSLTFGSPEQAVQTGLRMFLLGLSAVPTSAMAHIDFTRNINQVGCPKWLSLGMLVSLKFVSLIREEMGHIRMAMKLRGMQYHWYHPNVLYRGFIIPFLVRLMSISDMLTLSLETRAYSLQNKEVTSFKKITFEKEMVSIAYV